MTAGKSNDGAAERQDRRGARRVRRRAGARPKSQEQQRRESAERYMNAQRQQAQRRWAHGSDAGGFGFDEEFWQEQRPPHWRD